MVIECKVSEQTHQIIGDHYEAKRGFGSPEILKAKVFQSKITFEFFDSIFAIGSPA